MSVPPLALSAELLADEIMPPFSARVAELASVATPPTLASEFGLRARFSLPAPVALMLALILMLLWAVSVSETSVALVVVMALLSVMSPACAPPRLVVMVTLMPALSAACMVATVTTDESAVVVMLVVEGPLTTLTFASAVVLIVTLFGSSSHWPAFPPLPAPASANQPSAMSRCCLPEVSIFPPSPPKAPPRAAILP